MLSRMLTRCCSCIVVASIDSYHHLMKMMLFLLHCWPVFASLIHSVYLHPTDRREYLLVIVSLNMKCKFLVFVFLFYKNQQNFWFSLNFIQKNSKLLRLEWKQNVNISLILMDIFKIFLIVFCLGWKHGGIWHSR